MKRTLFALLLLASFGHAQEDSAKVDEATLKPLLGFELEPREDLPGGWHGLAATISVDETVVHSGKRAVRIERTPASAEKFSGVLKTLPIDFKGKEIELRGFAKSEDVSDFIAFWMQQNGEKSNLAFATTQGQGVRGTTGWTEYSITLPIHADAESLTFGFLLSGSGRAWADDLQLLVDGKPIWEAAKLAPVVAALGQDHEFDAGSKISLTALSQVQVTNLATLGRVWGFLKYHHPKVTTGGSQWDYELFRILPEILAAPDRAAANAALVRWIGTLGRVEPVAVGAELKDDLALRPDTGWLDDQATLGAE